MHPLSSSPHVWMRHGAMYTSKMPCCPPAKDACLVSAEEWLEALDLASAWHLVQARQYTEVRAARAGGEGLVRVAAAAAAAGRPGVRAGVRGPVEPLRVPGARPDPGGVQQRHLPGEPPHLPRPALRAGQQQPRGGGRRCRGEASSPLTASPRRPSLTCKTSLARSSPARGSKDSRCLHSVKCCMHATDEHCVAMVLVQPSIYYDICRRPPAGRHQAGRPSAASTTPPGRRAS